MSLWCLCTVRSVSWSKMLSFPLLHSITTALQELTWFTPALWLAACYPGVVGEWLPCFELLVSCLSLLLTTAMKSIDIEPDKLIISSSADHCDNSNTVYRQRWSLTACFFNLRSGCRAVGWWLFTHCYTVTNCVALITMVSRAWDDEFIRFCVFRLT